MFFYDELILSLFCFLLEAPQRRATPGQNFSGLYCWVTFTLDGYQQVSPLSDVKLEPIRKEDIEFLVGDVRRVLYNTRYYDAVIPEISEDKQEVLEKMLFEKKTLIETMKKRLSKFPRKQMDTDNIFSVDDDADYIPSDPSDTDQSLEELKDIVSTNKENRTKR